MIKLYKKKCIKNLKKYINFMLIEYHEFLFILGT